MRGCRPSSVDGNARCEAHPGTPGILIILPVLNESSHIGPLMTSIHSHLADHTFTICVIDDGSKDGTLDRLKEEIANGGHIHLITRKKVTLGSQRGSALKVGLKWGLEHTDHKVFIEMDGDLSHRPVELITGIDHITSRTCDVAIASKYLRGSRVLNRPVGRRAVSFFGNLLVRCMICLRIRDYSNGYRFYSREAAELLDQHRLRYGSPIYLTEALAVWLRLGMRIREFPSMYIGRNEGLSKLRWVDLAQAIMAVFEIAWRYHVTGFVLSGLLRASARRATE